MTKEEAVAKARALLNPLPPAPEWMLAKSGVSFDVGLLARVRADASSWDDKRVLMAFLAESRAIVEALIHG